MKFIEKKLKQSKNLKKFKLYPFVYTNFKQSINDLKLIKSYLIFVSILFLIITIIGFLFPIFFQEEMIKLLEKILLQTKDLGPIEITKFIMSNNIFSSFFAFIFGIILGIFPLAVAIINAYVLGFVINKSVEIGGIFIIWRLFPHGIFEIPAILISISLGLRLGWFPFLYHKNNKKQEFINIFNQSFRIFILIVIPLLVIAAIIEGSLIWFLP